MSLLRKYGHMNKITKQIDTVEEIDPRTSTGPRILHTFREEIELAGGPIEPANEEE